jgi:hypothetical protein
MVGHAYAGGFFLRARASCFPLLYQVGTRSATVRFRLARKLERRRRLGYCDAGIAAQTAPWLTRIPSTP